MADKDRELEREELIKGVAKIMRRASDIDWDVKRETIDITTPQDKHERFIPGDTITTIVIRESAQNG